jgi:hypothetical protein
MTGAKQVVKRVSSEQLRTLVHVQSDGTDDTSGLHRMADARREGQTIGLSCEGTDTAR